MKTPVRILVCFSGKKFMILCFIISNGKAIHMFDSVETCKRHGEEQPAAGNFTGVSLLKKPNCLPAVHDFLIFAPQNAL